MTMMHVHVQHNNSDHWGKQFLHPPRDLGHVAEWSENLTYSIM